MREAPMPEKAVPVEEIVEFTWNITGVIRVIVSQGHNLDGKFIPSPGVQSQQYTIMWEDYEEIAQNINKDEIKKGRPAGAIFIEDLWPYIDRCRQQKDAATKREIARRMGE